MEVIKVEVAPYWNVNLKSGVIVWNKKIVEVAPYWNVNQMTLN